MTGCTCEHPGWCERHQCHKHAHWHHLCKTNQAYFEAWEAGTGPGQFVENKGPRPASTVPHKEGWGDAVERHLKSIGVTQERYKEIKQMFGLPPTCGCDKRREWLNQVGRWWTGEK